jgi:hypothetical protein
VCRPAWLAPLLWRRRSASRASTLNAPIAMKAIVVVVVVLSENRAEGLVRPVYRGDGRGDSRDAPGTSTAAPLGYSPPEGGPSGPVSRRGVDDLRFGENRTIIKNILGNGNPPASDTRARQQAEPRRSERRGFQIVSIRAARQSPLNRHEPPSPASKGDPPKPSDGLEPSTPSLPWKCSTS